MGCHGVREEAHGEGERCGQLVGEEFPEKDRGGSVCDLVHAGRDLPQQSQRALGSWVLA